MHREQRHRDMELQVLQQGASVDAAVVVSNIYVTIRPSLLSPKSCNKVVKGDQTSCGSIASITQGRPNESRARLLCDLIYSDRIIRTYTQALKSRHVAPSPTVAYPKISQAAAKRSNS